MADNTVATPSRLKGSTIYTYGSVGTPLAMFGYPIAIWLPVFYSQELGVSLAAVGTMIMLARFTDVVTDPLIGLFSDHHHSKMGRRKPFMLAGLPVLILGVLMLFMPRQLGFETVGSLYLVFWISIMFLGATLVSIPYGAWGAELTPDYHERSRITAVREIFVLVGLLLSAVIPAFVEYFSDGSVSEILEAMAWSIVVLMPVLVVMVVWRVPEPQVEAHRKVALVDGLRMVAKNGPMVRILLIILIVTSGEAFRNALSIFFMGEVIEIGNRGTLFLYYFGAGLVAIPLWLWLGRKIGKHRAFAVCMGTVSIISVATYFLGAGDVGLFTALFIAKGMCFGGLQFLPLSMLADVVDVDTARSRGKRAGTFFAISGMTAKIATALGTGVSLNIVAFFGFDPRAASGPEALQWLAFCYTIIPAVFFLAALRLTWNYPLTAERQARLRGLIERRNARLSKI